MAKQIGASNLGTPQDTYFYTLATSKDEKTIATIASDDSLRIFDQSLNLLHTAKPCHDGVSSLIATSTGFITAGRDGLIKQWDFNGKQTAQLADPQGRGISSLAVHEEHYIAAGIDSTKEGLGDVSVLVYDTRNPSAPLRNYSESHTDAITQLAFHPTQPHILLSASTDGLVSFFNMNEADEDDALQRVLNPRSAVHCAGFLSDAHAYVLTTDEVFSIYPLADAPDGVPEEPVIEFGDVRAKLDCMYVIDLLHQPGRVPVVAYGHNERQTLAMVPVVGGPDAWAFGPAVEFPGAHGEEVVRDLFVTGDEKRAFTCGEDGHVRVWDLGAVAGVSADASSSSSRKEKKRKDKKDKKKERFAPY